MYISRTLNYFGVKKIVEYNGTPKPLYNCKQYVYFNLTLCFKYVRPVRMNFNQNKFCINKIKYE